MMTMGSWMRRIREARPIRDVLGVVLLAATALLYAAERHRAEAAESAGQIESAVVVETTEDVDVAPAGVVLETTQAPSKKETNGRA